MLRIVFERILDYSYKKEPQNSIGTRVRLRDPAMIPLSVPLRVPLSRLLQE